MADKKNKFKFTIQFSENNPGHVKAVQILNNQGMNSKANYIAQAVIFYESAKIRSFEDFDKYVDEKIAQKMKKTAEKFQTDKTPEDLPIADIGTTLENFKNNRSSHN